jgi:hypothetical protein
VLKFYSQSISFVLIQFLFKRQTAFFLKKKNAPPPRRAPHLGAWYESRGRATVDSRRMKHATAPRRGTPRGTTAAAARAAPADDCRSSI